ncbi:MAG: DNA polymerase/3'-5' exonuclease PolX [Chloroflexi bacterium]|nr:MAG: DNA polymerase/3'-5' exonuclease PolX [Chloroflexota bacterium]
MRRSAAVATGWLPRPDGRGKAHKLGRRLLVLCDHRRVPTPRRESAAADPGLDRMSHVETAVDTTNPELDAVAVEQDAALLTNGQLARMFHEIGDMLEVKGELVYKTVAYHRAADAIAHSPVEVAEAYRAGNPPRIPGVGAAISDKLAELAQTGRLQFYERLRTEVPPTLVEMLDLPGLGPRTVKLLYETLGIENVEALRDAAERGLLRDVKGLSARTEESILQAIATLETRPQRLLLNQANAIVDQVIGDLEGTPGLRRVEKAGSLRRWQETIGDLDLLAETDDPDALIERFVGLAAVDRVLNRGSYKAAIKLLRGPQVDLMVMPPGEAGTYEIHFTGNKDHNVRLRGRARDRGWSLSEKGYMRLGEDGEPLAGPNAELRTFATEGEAYAFLDLPFIEPELRQDRGEIEAALAGTLPTLVTLADLNGDCHTHSDRTDGVHTVEQMAEAGRRRGYAYQVLTDHSQSLAIARGLNAERVEEERELVGLLNQKFAREEEQGTAPPGTPPEGFRLLFGCELEIRADGQLDFPDELLARYDVVVASLHVGRRQPRVELTRRVMNALRNPNVDIIAHPAGRYIQRREDLDLDWDAVFAEAARTGTLLEMNGSPHRLDLSDHRARRAVAAGCTLTIDSDAHRIEELDYMRWGVSQARRAWVTPELVANTWSRAKLLDWVARKPERVS